MIVILGDSGSGKSTLKNLLVEHCSFIPVVPCTTRLPREGEIEGIDYRFLTNEKFEQYIADDLFAEYDKYSQDRYYGTLKTECIRDNCVAVLTPNGLRNLKNSGIPITSVYVRASLGRRIIRYIERCGVDKFDFDDKNEIAARVERDYGMFLGLENEVDYVLDNDHTDLNSMISQVYDVLMIHKMKGDN